MPGEKKQLVPDLQMVDKGKVECLGQYFENDDERKEFFRKRLQEALHELEEKLSGVPFTTVDDAVERLSSLSKWPVGSQDGLRDIASRMKDSEQEKDLLQRFKDEIGFPHGTLEDILNLSDPPYYTACPNPFVADFIKRHGKPYDPDEKYHREPFAADVSEGKNDPIYNAHSYHTKVPHKAIMRYILHYTEPGDIVYDGFCGTGMTGVAAHLCGDRKTVESLGYKVQKDGTVLQKEEEDEGAWKPFSKLGPRSAILNDLSPAATFIAYNYNTPVDVKQFEREAKRILAETEKECGWMYTTLHTEGTNLSPETVEELAQRVQKASSIDEVKKIMETNAKHTGKINYTVWSDVFICPSCSKEIIFWDVAVDKKQGKVKPTFSCPHCHLGDLKKRDLERAWITKFDSAINTTVRQAKQVPVLINYTAHKGRLEKTPDAFDTALLNAIDQTEILYWFPTTAIPKGDKTGEPLRLGITHTHHFYTKRNLSVLATIWAKAQRSQTTTITFLVEQVILGMSKLARYAPSHYSQANQYLSGTLYIGSQVVEVTPRYILGNKVGRLTRAFRLLASVHSNIISTHNSARTSPHFDTIDYIFTDPPFGSNLMYSELNFLWESWHNVFTANKDEAIENKVQGKALVDYQHIMQRCFAEYYRVLKPGHWMTVVFHNSKNSVWNAIQEALWGAGFVVADVGTLDKQQGTFNQVTVGGAVKQDLVISLYKPTADLEERFGLAAGTGQAVWDFIRAHLRQLVRVNAKKGVLEVQQERMNYLLYDRMVSFHVQRGITVPLSAAEFYAGLDQRFPMRDGMYFLPDQAAEYDKRKMKAERVQQLALFVSDERTALLWLRQQLTKKPHTFQELHPLFTKDSRGWLKFEEPVELQALLEKNFLRYDGIGPIPGQIVSWLKQSEHHRPKIREMEKAQAPDALGLETDDQDLINASKDRWYIPDPNKAADLEKLRDKELLRVFEEYKQSTARRLRVFRLEAVRAGFKKAWQDRDFETIIKVGEKIPPLVLQEDENLLMFYHQALTRTGRG